MKKNIYTSILVLIIIILLISSCTEKALTSSNIPEISSNFQSISISSRTYKESSVKPDISGKNNLWANTRLSVGFINAGASEGWTVQLIQYTMDISKEWNIELKFKDSQSKWNLQMEQLESLIEEKVDVIGLRPLIETGYEEVFTKAKEAGIPIILIDRTVNCADESLWTSHIVNDWEKEGRMAGEWLIDYLKKHGQLDKGIKIVEISGTDGAEATIDRGQGFREAIKENLKITISKCGDFTQAKGYEEMTNILSETTDIDVLFCHNDDMALGAIQAIEEAGLVPGEDIIIISIEGRDEALKAIVEGKIACSVECNPLMGDLFMEACVRLANGEEIEREIHPVDRVFDITNAQAELDARKANGYGY